MGTFDFDKLGRMIDLQGKAGKHEERAMFATLSIIFGAIAVAGGVAYDYFSDRSLDYATAELVAAGVLVGLPALVWAASSLLAIKPRRQANKLKGELLESIEK